MTYRLIYLPLCATLMCGGLVACNSGSDSRNEGTVSPDSENDSSPVVMPVEFRVVAVLDDYDADGIVDRRHEFSYDADGRVTTVISTSDNSAGATRMVSRTYDGDMLVQRSSGSDSTMYLWESGRMVGFVDQNFS